MRKRRERRDIQVYSRLNDAEYAKLKLQMDLHGYICVSCYLRDLITKQKIQGHRAVVDVGDKVLAEKLNLMVYQVNKIGVNYNQVVATWQKQASQTRRDGTPWMDTRSVELRLGELQRMTEGLRDEFAVILDVVRKYIGGSREQ